MKRSAAKVVVFLLLLLAGGAIVNVAVAWGCATYKANRQFDDSRGLFLRLTRAASTRITVEFGRIRLTQDGPGLNADYLYWSQPINDSQYRQLVPKWSAFISGEPTQPGSQADCLMYYVEVGAGWPAYSLWYAIVHPNDTTARSHYVGGVELSNRFESLGLCGALPLTIVPPGFAINTIFYAAVLWMVFAFPFVVRRRRRIKRGLCPACAYPVGASPVCTECGAAISLRRSDGM